MSIIHLNLIKWVEQEKKGRIKTMTQQLQNAINKSSRTKMAVKFLGNRSYLVATPQAHKYTVRFENVEALRYRRCNCKAGAANMACYHLPKAAMVDTAIQSIRSH